MDVGIVAKTFADDVVRIPQINSAIRALPGGDDFLWYYEKCSRIADIAYLSPYALKFFKGFAKGAYNLSKRGYQTVSAFTQNGWVKLKDYYAKVKERLGQSGVILEELVENKRLWTQIDEFDGLSNGKMVTFYDVRVTYQTERVRAGISFKENEILNFDINLPAQLQGQGVGTEIFKKAIAQDAPSQVQGLWKASDNYLGGESINLTIFKQKISEGLTPIQAAFETPTGKILKLNGFGGTPTILVNTSSEVRILFKP